MSTEPFIGEVKLLGFKFAPYGYSLCDGTLLSIAEYTALYALVGTIYGGDGQSTFGLPNLQSRMPVGQGNGDGLPNFVLGEAVGRASTTLTTANMPYHNHGLSKIDLKMPAYVGNAEEQSPQDNYPATTTNPSYASQAEVGVYLGIQSMVSGTTSVAGGSQPFDIMSPYLGMNFSIAIEGIFPPRN